MAYSALLFRRDRKLCCRDIDPHSPDDNRDILFVTQLESEIVYLHVIAESVTDLCIPDV